MNEDLLCAPIAAHKAYAFRVCCQQQEILSISIMQGFLLSRHITLVL